jgi:hypothetical protein
MVLVAAQLLLLLLSTPGSPAGASVEQLVASVERAAADLVAAQAALVAAQQQQQQPPVPQQRRAPECPGLLTVVDNFTVHGTAWVACEDLAVPGGALVLLSAAGAQEWFDKSHEPYIQGDDEEYYLGLGKKVALAAKTDLLGQTILTQCEKHNPGTNLCEPTWARVERAVPIMRNSGESGVRTFVGSRGASVDATFSDKAEDKSSNGFPPVQMSD